MGAPNVVDVTDESFAQNVLEESYRRPVVVDFWADWCQPCKLIGPVLERLAVEAQGDFLLAKLDVDSNPQAAAAFRDGQVATEFIGAIPEQSIRQFLRSVLPSEADRLADAAEAAVREGRVDQAEDLYRR